MTPKTLSTPWSPRFVTVIVAVGELGAAQDAGARAAHEVARARASASRGPSASASLQRGRDEAAAAQRDRDAEVDGVRRMEGAVLEGAVQLGHLARGERDGAQQQRGRQQALRDGAARVLGREPGERAREVDAGAR